MKEFQVFCLIKQKLSDHLNNQPIYFNTEAREKPCCVIELEEIWSLPLSLANQVSSRVKFKTTSVSEDDLLSSQVALSQRVVSILDGLTLSLEDQKKAAIKFSKTLVNACPQGKVQSISQVFEAVIRD